MPRGQSKPFEDQLAKIDNAIAKHQKNIETLTTKKNKLIANKDKDAFNSVLTALKESGKTPEEILALINQKSA